MDEGLAIVGSANMDLRSLFLDYEVSAFVYKHAGDPRHFRLGRKR